MSRTLKVTPQELEARAELLRLIALRREALDQVLAEVENVTDELSLRLAAVAGEYNAQLEPLRDWIAVTAERLRGETGERSERWRESERGQSALAWIELFDDALREIEDYEPDEALIVNVAPPDGLDEILAAIPNEPT